MTKNTYPRLLWKACRDLARDLDLELKHDVENGRDVFVLSDGQTTRRLAPGHCWDELVARWSRRW